MGVSRGGLPPTPVDEHFHAMAFSVVGVVLIVSGLADTASIIGNHAAEESLRQSGMVVESWSIAPLAKPAVELVAGLLLFLRGRGLASLWHRMRHPTLEHHGANSE
jgi:hypothetical protein